MTPASGAIVINTFSAGGRGRAMGTYAGISMISLALAPLLGGLLTRGVAWQAVFWINIPIGLAMLVLAQLSLPTDGPERGAAMDWAGAAMLVPGLVMIVLALMQAAQWGWTWPATIALLGLGAALLAAFTLTEAGRSSPLVRLKLFSSRNFSVSTMVLGCVQFALTGGALYISGAVVLAGAVAAWTLLRRVPAADAPRDARGTVGAAPAPDVSAVQAVSLG
jgi:MFS family permease